MSEKLIDYEYTQDNGVDSLRVVGDAVSQGKLDAFQDTLKDDVVRRGMFAFVTKLNNLEKLEAKASELRKKSGDAIVINQPSINGVAIPVEKPADPEITAHNEQIRALKSAIDEFNRTRAEFLKTFIARYMNPQPVRVDPTPGTRGPQRPAGDDMFSQSIRDSIRGAKPTRADTPDVQVGRNTLTGALAALAGGGEPPSEGGVLDENGNLRGPQAARIAADFGGSNRYKAKTDKK